MCLCVCGLRSTQIIGVYLETLTDARSVSLYPYNPSQILQYIKYTKQINIVKGIENNIVFLDKE